MVEKNDYRQSHTASDKGAVYDQHFESFAWRRHLWEREQAVLKLILQEFYSSRRVDYLDFACGTGRILEFMRKHVTTAAGVDLSESMLAQCRQKVPDVTIFKGDITQENVLGDCQFNLMTAFRFFPNAQEDLRDEALDALAWHLTDDGLLVFNNHKNESGLLFKLARLFGRKLNTMSVGDVNGLLEKVGFEVVKTYSLGVLPGHDRGMWVPGWMHDMADRFAQKTGQAEGLCQNNIYVCRKRDLTSQQHEAFEEQTEEMTEVAYV